LFTAAVNEHLIERDGFGGIVHVVHYCAAHVLGDALISIHAKATANATKPTINICHNG
jgi:hypothetical protein